MGKMRPNRTNRERKMRERKTLSPVGGGPDHHPVGKMCRELPRFCFADLGWSIICMYGAMLHPAVRLHAVALAMESYNNVYTEHGADGITSIHYTHFNQRYANSHVCRYL